MAPYRYNFKKIAKQWRSKNIITSMELGFTIFYSVSSDNFFVIIYTFLSLVLSIDFCYSQLIIFCILFKKDKKIRKLQKRWNNLKKMNSLKKGEGIPLLNFERDPGVPLLNFEVGPGVPLLNFRKVPGGSWVSGSQGPGSWGPGPTFIPCLSWIHLFKTKKWRKVLKLADL